MRKEGFWRFCLVLITSRYKFVPKILYIVKIHLLCSLFGSKQCNFYDPSYFVKMIHIFKKNVYSHIISQL